MGFIAYYSKLPIYDLFGLVTREMVESSFFFSDVMGSKYEVLQSLPPAERPRFFFVQRSRFEERGDEAHLAPLRSRQIFTIPSDAFPTIGLDPSIYEIDWSLAGRASTMRDPKFLQLLETQRIADELNVADLHSHAAHSYKYLPPLSGAFPANRIVTADSIDGVRVQEGAWGVLYGESFEVRATAGKPLRVVLRTNYIDNRLRIVVNGASAGEITAKTPDPQKWYELDLEISATLVRDRNHIQVFGKFMSAHYWFLQ